ncbi:NACHT domain-containing protein [Paraburkholderia sediminicola]|uniref:NACHT domain-containing protein n=1 Tax=Paraburkholderia sediminicola TaxID=458836 RepID=UPI0038BDAB32
MPEQTANPHWPTAVVEVSESTAEEELQRLQPLPMVEPTGVHAPLDKQEPRVFEFLLYRLCQSGSAKTWCEVSHDRTRLMQGVSEKGRDVVLYRAQLPVAIVQCKRYASSLPLPEAVKEVCRFLLAAKLLPRLLPRPDDFTYVMAVATKATEPTADFFDETSRVLKEHPLLVEDAVKKVIADYKSLNGLDLASSVAYVLDRLAKIRLKLLQREQLELWLAECEDVFKTFFKTRVVVDSTAVSLRLDRIESKLDKGLSLDCWDSSAVTAALAVGSISGRSFDARAVGLADVYVPRTISSEIDGWISETGDETDGVLVCIVAPGGFGKTSLLWDCHRRWNSQEGSMAVLCSAPLLSALVDQGRFEQALDELERNARDLRNRGTRFVFCLDTFDTLVHRANTLSATLRVVQRLIQAGAAVVLTSRPEEISELSLDALARRHVHLFLREYDEGEFAHAVKSHCEAFYQGRSAKQDVSRHVQRLTEVVALGRPIKRVCLNPLTLRMLFELYAPGEIPENISAYSLYAKYWIARVKGDRRTGTPAVTTMPKDLTHAAELLASQMYELGVPSLSHRQVETLVLNGNLDDQDVRELINRHLLIRTDVDLEFFHQTFFEFTAARVEDARANSSLEACLHNLEQYVNDGFRFPVYEQMLWRYAYSTIRPETLESAVATLMCAGHPALSGVALRLHMMVDNGYKACTDLILSRIASGDTLLLKRYCQLVYSLNAARFREVETVIVVAWSHATWQALELISRLFVWLAHTDWNSCQKLLDEIDPIERLYAKGARSAHVDRILMSILRPALSTNPDYATRQALRCLRIGHRRETVLRFIAESVDFMSQPLAKEVADGLLTMEKPITLTNDEAGIDSGSSCLRSLWERFPQLCPEHLADMPLIDDAETRLTLRALAQTNTECGRLNQFKSSLLAKADGNLRPLELHVLLHNFVLPLMRSHQRGDPYYSEAAQSCERILTRLVVGKHLNAIPSAVEKGNTKVFCSFLRELHTHHACPPPVIAEVERVSTEQWLKGDAVMQLFPIALSRNMVTAVMAFETVCSAPAAHPRIVAFLHAYLSSIAVTGEHFDLMLRFAFANQDIVLGHHLLARAIANERLPVLRSRLAPQVVALNSLAVSATASRKSRMRTAAYTLLSLLTTHKLLEGPTYEEARQWFESERHSTARMAALGLLVSRTGAKQAEETIGHLLQVAGRSSPKSLNLPVHQLSCVLKINGLRLPNNVIMDILAFALKANASEPQVSLVGWLIDVSCAAGNVTLANTAALALLQSATVHALGATQKRTLAHHLDKPFQRLYRQLSAEHVREHFAILHSADPLIGRLVVVAICKSDRLDREHLAEELVNDNQLEPSLRGIVADYQRYLWKQFLNVKSADFQLGVLTN